MHLGKKSKQKLLHFGAFFFTCGTWCNSDNGSVDDAMSAAEKLSGPCDLCLPTDAGDVSLAHSVKARVLRAFNLGYRTVAVEVRVDQSQLGNRSAAKKAAKRAKVDKEEKAKMTDFPEPPSVKLTEQDLAPFESPDGGRPSVLTRLTVAFKDNNFLPVFNRSETAPKYDLLALIPASAAAMQALLKTGFRADLLAMDPETCRDVRWTRKLYLECTSKGGMHFEVPYAAAIRSSTDRRTIISQSHNYHSVGKSKSVVLSSGARSPIELRGPHDVANLGFVLGLNEHQGKLAVCRLPMQVVSNALGRKLGPFRAKIEKISDMDAGDLDKVPGGKNKDYDDHGDEDEEEEEEEESCDFLKL